jgi:endonuclease/exonuclease/phosphatase family metal-dependent hydrolase
MSRTKSQPSSAMLNLMTFNIRYGLADDRGNRWDNRKSLVLERIRACDPDLLGLQECRDDSQAEFIRENLPEYEFYGVPRGGGSVTALEMAPILFKKSAFRLVQKGCFWLSDTPHVPGSVSWDATFPRTATWAQLIHLASGRELLFLNTHFDYTLSAIGGSARLLQAWLTQAAETHPILVTGDFNADKNSSAYRQLTVNAPLLDVYRQIHPTGGDEGTFHGFGQADELSPIDWILACNSFRVVSAKIDRHHTDGIHPSDHFPVTATLQWKGTRHAH